jgi:hypothetical protein
MMPEPHDDAIKAILNAAAALLKDGDKSYD